jgi:hypothetical protein
MARCIGYPLWYFQTRGIAQAVSSYQATEFIDHIAASLSGQAKAVLQEAVKMTPTLTCALAKTAAQSQQQIPPSHRESTGDYERPRHRMPESVAWVGGKERVRCCRGQQRGKRQRPRVGMRGLEYRIRRIATLIWRKGVVVYSLRP